MIIEGEIEGIEKKIKQDTGEPYIRVKMKGRTFITFDTDLMNELPELSGGFVRLTYAFFKGNEKPNVYRLDAAVKL